MRNLFLIISFCFLFVLNISKAREKQIDKLKSIIDQETSMYVIFVPANGLITCNNGKLKLYKSIAHNYNKELKSIAVFVGFNENETNLLESIKQNFTDDYFISDFDQSIINYFGINIIPSILNVSNNSKNYKVIQEDIGINFQLKEPKEKKFEIEYIEESFNLTKIGEFIKNNNNYFIIDENVKTCLVLDKLKKTINEKIKYDQKFYKSIENKENWENYKDSNLTNLLKFYIENKVHLESFSNFLNINGIIYTQINIVKGVQNFLSEDNGIRSTLAYNYALVNIENAEIKNLDLDSKVTYEDFYHIGNNCITEISDLNYNRDSILLFEISGGNLLPAKKFAIDDSIKILNNNQYFQSKSSNYCISLFDNKLFKLNENFKLSENLSLIFTDLNNNFLKNNLKPIYLNYIEKNGKLYILVKLRNNGRAYDSYQLIEINLEDKTHLTVFEKIYSLDYNIVDIKLFDILEDGKFEFLIKLEDARWALYRKWL